MKGAKSNAKKSDSKLAVNKKPAKASRASKKAAKDPNKPKRPSSAFFVFMEEFRKQFNKENPNNKAVSAVGKAAGAKWKTMSDAEKAPYVAKSDKRKVEYEKSMKAYNLKQAEGNTVAEEEGSEVNDDDDGDDEGSDEEDDDDE